MCTSRRLARSEDCLEDMSGPRNRPLSLRSGGEASGRLGRQTRSASQEGMDEDPWL